MNNVNIPALRKVVEWAEAEAAKPEHLCEWYQGLFVMPTSADDPVLSSLPEGSRGTVMARRVTLALDCGTAYCIAGKVAFDSGRAWTYSTAGDVAQEELGLTDSQAVWLFSAGNSIEDVREIAESLAGERL